MRNLPLAVVLACLLSIVLAASTKSLPTPPSKLTMTMPPAVSVGDEIPVKLTFSNPAEETIRFNSFSCQFVLFDDQGVQVAVSPFIQEAVGKEIVLDGREPVYKPRMAFDTRCKGLLIIGRTYQLVCVLPLSGMGALASSSRFTLGA